MFRNIESVCPFCGVGCRIVFRVRDNRAVSVYPGEGLPNEGKLCIKGWTAHEFIHHPDRLTSPMIREHRSLPFRPVSWDEALNFTTARLRAIIETHGRGTAGFISSAKCTNEDNYALQKFARAVAGAPHIDHCARLCHASTVAGLIAAFGSGAMTNSIEELENAQVILVIGSNTTEQHPLIARRILRAVRGNGAALIVADPRRIGLTEFATLHLQHRPGSDAALINGIIRSVIDQGLQDSSFIETRTDGFDMLKESLSFFAPEQVAALTGVDAELIVQAADIFGRAERASIVYAMGITQHTAGTDNVLALANLAMATGNVGRSATGINPLRGQNNVQGACDMGALPSVYPGYQQVNDCNVRQFFAKKWHTDVLPNCTGLTLCEMMDALVEERIRFMYIMGENPALSNPDSAYVRQALTKAEFLVVQDIFPSDTARYAHAILPAASFAEKDGTFTSTERRVQRIHKVIDPVGESRAEWSVIADIALRLGYGHMQWQSAEEIFEEIRSVTPGYGGITYARLEHGGIQWPCPVEGHPGTPFLHKDRFPIGKGRFTPVEYRPQPEEPDEGYPFVLTTGRSLFHFHTGTMTRRSPTLDTLLKEAYGEINRADADACGIEDGQYMRLTTRRGFIRLRARVTGSIGRGVIFVPIHFAEAAANILTPRHLDPKSKIPELKACAVKIEKDNENRQGT